MVALKLTAFLLVAALASLSHSTTALDFASVNATEETPVTPPGSEPAAPAVVLLASTQSKSFSSPVGGVLNKRGSPIGAFNSAKHGLGGSSIASRLDTGIAKSNSAITRPQGLVSNIMRPHGVASNIMRPAATGGNKFGSSMRGAGH